MATAPAPATKSTVWRWVSRHETVASMKRSRPFSNTNATGSTAFNCQFKRTMRGFDIRGLISSCAGGRTEAASGLTSVRGCKLDSVLSFVLGIGMQARQQVRDSEECEHHYCESEDRKVRRPAPAPSASDAH